MKVRATVTIEHEVLTLARLHAAAKSMSLSEMLQCMLEQHLDKDVCSKHHPAPTASEDELHEARAHRRLRRVHR